MEHPVDPPLTPLQQLLPSTPGASDAWLATGNDPQFEANFIGQAGLAGGWYLLELDIEVHRGSVHLPSIYPGGRGYYVEAESVSIPLINVKRGRVSTRRLVRFVHPLHQLRFDPSTAPCEFTLHRFRLTRVTKMRAMRAMVGSLLADADGMDKAKRILAAGLDLLTGGPRRLGDGLYRNYACSVAASPISDYRIWLDFYDDCTADGLDLACSILPDLRDPPLISVVMPVYNTPERWLRAAIESVINQRYESWQLCIADDDSSDSRVWEVVQEYVAKDARIKAVRRRENGHISAASNSALELATGRYVALMDHDDELHPLALRHCAVALQDNPEWRMLYTDEDKIDECGNRSDPYFKSDWNPELFLSQNCVCHLAVYDKGLVDRVNGFRTGYEGAQDWDLTLRITEMLDPSQIGHVPRVLYHWRMIKGSTALAPGEKNYAHDAAKSAIQDHLDRVLPGASVRELEGLSGYFRIRHRIPEPAPLVSILIPTRDGLALLRRCVESILELSTYPRFEIVILDNGSRESATLAWFQEATRDTRVRVERYDHPFNYSAINNFGAERAKGEVLLLLNNDTSVITPGWLEEMVSHVIRPGIGAVGAMLYYPNDTIQHAGVVLGIGGVAGHRYVGCPRGYPGDKHRGALAQATSAVTAACLAIRKSVFQEVGGLDERLRVAFNDIDFCIRVREAGYRNVWTPYAELYHYESATRGYENTPAKIERFKSEELFMQSRWGQHLESDPYYNPNYSLSAGVYSLSYPPRVRSSCERALA